MPELDRYIPGVPCWIDTIQPDPDARRRVLRRAVRLGARGDDAAGRARQVPPGAARRRPRRRRRLADGDAAPATWNTYIWVDSADETAAKVREAGGSVLSEPFDIFDSGRMAFVRRPRGRGVRRLAAEPAPRRAGRQRAGQPSTSTTSTPATSRARRRSTARCSAGRRSPMGGCGRCPATATTSRRSTPGTRERTKEMGAPDALHDVVAAVSRDHGRRAAALGRDVRGRRRRRDRRAARGARRRRSLVPPFDAPWIRGTRDPRPAGRDVQREPVRAREQGPRGAGRPRLRRHQRPLGRRRSAARPPRRAAGRGRCRAGRSSRSW